MANRDVILILSNDKMDRRELNNSMAPWASVYTIEELSDEFRKTIGERTAIYAKYESGFLQINDDDDSGIAGVELIRLHRIKNYTTDGWIRKKIDIHNLGISALIDLDDPRDINQRISTRWPEVLQTILEHQNKKKYVYRVICKWY